MDCKKTIDQRVEWIKTLLRESGAKGVIYGNSGGKDCTLVGALAKLATPNVLGVIMPCGSSRNYGSDRDDALRAGKCFDIEQIEVDLTATKDCLVSALGTNLEENHTSEYALKMAGANINPRLRMSVLYALGQSKGYLVAGTGNLCEITMGYFTKWGDGACDFNPIADLTVPEIYELLEYLGAPENIIFKAPSAGLYEGQTDEQDMGVTYGAITAFCKGEPVDDTDRAKIERAYRSTQHKRRMPRYFPE
jgi:NAD+ synthase